MNGQTKLKDYLDRWIGTTIKGNVRHNTYSAYQGYIKNHIVPNLGELQLFEVKADIIQQFIFDLGNKELSPKTIHVIASMLSSALQCATNYEYIFKNPCAKMRLPKVEEKEVEVFTEDEQDKIVKAVLKSRDKRHLGILICLYTGLRIGELCALKWSNVDFVGASINIKEALSKAEIIDSNGKKRIMLTEQEPKTKKSKRLIPLPEFLCDILKRHAQSSNSEYVISMPTGNRVHPRTMQRLYTKLIGEAGVAYKKFHTQRHTFATRAIENMADIKTLSEILGHSNATITINRYVHSLAEQKRKIMQNMSDYYIRKQKTAQSCTDNICRTVGNCVTMI
jgi:integrase